MKKLLFLSCIAMLCSFGTTYFPPPPISTSYSFMRKGTKISEHLGQEAKSAGDVNGDGYGDVLVGAPGYFNGQAGEGAVLLYYGSATGLNPIPVMIESNQSLAGFGWTANTAGDVNGDGYSEIIMGAYNYDNGQVDEGVVFLYYGSAAGLVMTPVILEMNVANEFFGGMVASAGDINNDGYGDIIVGNSFADIYGVNSGAAYIYMGSATGITATTPYTRLDYNTTNFATSVASAGDLNGDGYGDIAIGDYLLENPNNDEGAFFIYYGTATGINTTLGLKIEGDAELMRLGYRICTAGDSNGDGYDDLLVGATGYANGQVYEGAVFLYYGSAAGLNPTAVKLVEGNQNDAQFGFSMSYAGDVNGDGYGDVVFGAPNYDMGFLDQGIVYVYYGSASGLSSSNRTSLQLNRNRCYFGIVSGAGDVNGDGLNDIVVGSVIYTDPTGEGAFFIFNGIQDMTLPVKLISFTAKSQNTGASTTTVACNWSTATEENSSHFVVERSSNGNGFMPIGYVMSTNNSTIQQHYSFIDHTPVKGISHYRLKMVDNDGKFTYSRIVAVTTTNTETLFTIYPNPVKEEAMLAVSIDKKQKALYSIYDQAGRKLLSNTVSLNEGLNSISLPVTSLSAGIYIIELQTDAVFKQSRFVKQ